jgi:hypothetical protein
LFGDDDDEQQKAEGKPEERQARAADVRAAKDTELLKELGRLFVRFPHRARILHQFRVDFEFEMSRNDERDQGLILDAIRLGCWTLQDIREETNLKDQEIRAHLRVMVNDGRVRIDTEGVPGVHRGPQVKLFKPGVQRKAA